MIIPVRCFTCNRVLASKYKTYKQIVSKNSEEENIISGNPDFDPTKNAGQVIFWHRDRNAR